MAADREKNTLLCHADTLEEVSGDDLKTNQWTDEDNESHTIDGEFCELLVLREKADRDVREELANDKGNRHHDSSIDDGIFQHQVHTVEFACTIVVASNWLHTLTNAHHHHHKQEGDTVNNTVGSYGEVASMRLQTLVDENHYEARTKLHAER